MALCKIARGYVICSPAGDAFLDQGTGNTEYDVDMVTASLGEATVFATEAEAVNYFTPHPKTKSYWGSKELAVFFKHAVVRRVRLKLFLE